MAAEETSSIPCYKVVSIVDGKRMSAMHGHIPDSVEYSSDSWTEAPYGGLLVFDSFEWAADFVNGRPRVLEIWKVEVFDLIPLGCRGYFPKDDNYRELWKLSADSSIWPRGTQAYKFVKLESLVYHGNPVEKPVKQCELSIT